MSELNGTPAEGGQNDQNSPIKVTQDVAPEPGVDALANITEAGEGAKAAETSVAEVAAGVPSADDAKSKAEGAPAGAIGDEKPEVSAEFKPSFNFKASDKDMEMDEFVRPIIKDAETEKKVRELYEKAYGLDSVKEDRTKARDDLKTARERNEQIVGNVRELQGLRDADPKAFLAAVGIPWVNVLNMVAEEIRVQTLPPEQQRVHEDNALARRQAYDQSRDTQSREREYQSRLVEMTATQVDLMLTRPDVAAAAQSFDARPDKPYSFKDLVYNLGSAHFDKTQQQLPVADAVGQALAIVGPTTAPQVIPGQGSPAPLGLVPATTTTALPPPVPNIGGGRPATPTSRIFNSLEDLEKFAEQKLKKG